VTAVKETRYLGGLPPRALIVSCFGLYARESGGWLGVAGLIRLLAELGVDAAAVRSSVSRLKRRGILVPERVDGAAGYTLSASARAILDEGDRRIFEPGRAALADGWLLAVFSVPESERDKRHQLRTRLAGLGFGTVAAGVWIAPARLRAETAAVLERHGLAGYVDLFRAEHLGFAEVRGQLDRWWDLDTLSLLHRDFLVRYAPLARRTRPPDDRQAFAQYLPALTDWRRLPYADPGLPAEVLPRDWPGVRAGTTFFAIRDRLAAPAHRFADTAFTR